MTEPLKILHAHSGNLFGGVETILTTLARHQGTLRHTFALAYEGRLAGHLRGSAAAVDVLGDVRLSRPWTLLSVRRRLRSIIAAERPTVVMCHSPWALSVFGPAARSSQVPLVFWAHDALTGRHWLERLARRTANPDFAISNSNYTRTALASAFPNVRGRVVYPPVEAPPTFDPARRPAKREGHGAAPDTVVIALVARFEPWKGHASLLDALSSLRELPRWTAWIIGGAQRRSEDVYRAALERRTNEARIADRVHFLGQRDDIASLLWAADIYCQPNTSPEPFGVSLVEALYAGLPVITADCGGAREIVTPDCGLRIPPGDPTALRDALHMLITDANLRARLGLAGPARAATLCAPTARVADLHDSIRQAVHLAQP